MRETNDEIPNLGFSLSNKKLLKTGFEFLYNLEESIKEMILKWSKKDIVKDLEYVKKVKTNLLTREVKLVTMNLLNQLILLD